MHALKDFFTTDYGLLSAIVLFLTLCMLSWFVRFFLTNVKRDTEKAEAAARAAAGAGGSEKHA